MTVNITLMTINAITIIVITIQSVNRSHMVLNFKYLEHFLILRTFHCLHDLFIQLHNPVKLTLAYLDVAILVKLFNFNNYFEENVMPINDTLVHLRTAQFSNSYFFQVYSATIKKHWHTKDNLDFYTFVNSYLLQKQVIKLYI